MRGLSVFPRLPGNLADGVFRVLGALVAWRERDYNAA